MNRFSTRVLAAAIALSAPALGAQGITYAPGTAKYHISSNSHQSQTVQGQTTAVTVTSEQYVTVTVSPKSRDTLQYVVTFDSGTAKSDNPMVPVPDVQKMRGFKYTGTMSPLGKRYVGSPSDTTSDGAKEIGMAFERFFLALPANAKAGSTWTEPVSTKTSRQGIDLVVQVTSNYQIMGDTTVAGQKAWKIARTATISTTGSGVSNGQVITIESSGKAAGTVLITPMGLYLSSVVSQDQLGKVTLPAMSLDIPQTVTITTKTEIMK
ncbi:MAG: hypothetical protein M3081_05800 [Gemmatimonadota bacterium]|nr:hypothetical protein [Gemmatimonadota bacterium]